MSMQVFAIFVKHPPHLPQDKLQAVIQSCGRLFRWKPTRDPSTGQPKNFGFAEFADMDGVARVMRLLTPLKFADGSALLLRLDKAMQQTYQHFINTHPPVDSQAEEYALQSIKENLGEYLGEDESTQFLSSVFAPVTPSVQVENLPPPADANDSKGQSVLTTDPAPRGFVKESKDANDDNEEERKEEEQAKKRDELRRQDMHRIYLTELNKWEARERYRSKLRQENEDRERRWAEQNDPTSLLDYYSHYDDDKEAERGSADIWFQDRDKWIEKRKRSREYEEQWDENARRREERPAVAPVSNSRAMAERGVREDHSALKAAELMTMLRQLVKRDLPFLHPMSRLGSRPLFEYRIDWSRFSKDILQTKVLPLIENKVTRFLGEKDSDLVDFIVEAITPGEDGQDKYAMDMLAEITTAFGESDEEKDEAKDLVEQLWRCIIWETEKRRVINGRSVSGLEVPWEDLEVEHVQ